MKPSIGVSKPLYAKCLSLQSKDTRLMIIGLDSIGAGLKLTQEAFKKATEQGNFFLN